MKRFFSAAAAFLMVFSGSSKGYAQTDQENGSPQDNAVNALELSNRKEKDVKKMLLKLEKSKPPKKLATGAMCYKPAVNKEEYEEYVCPVDGEKTAYSGSEKYLIRSLVVFRSGVDHLNKIAPKGMTFSLDETELCKKHTPEAQERHIYLVLTYDDGRIARNAVINDTDFKILDAFFNDETTYFDSTDYEHSLKPEVKRIKQLLGVT